VEIGGDTEYHVILLRFPWRRLDNFFFEGTLEGPELRDVRSSLLEHGFSTVLIPSQALVFVHPLFFPVWFCHRDEQGISLVGFQIEKMSPSDPQQQIKNHPEDPQH